MLIFLVLLGKCPLPLRSGQIIRPKLASFAEILAKFCHFVQIFSAKKNQFADFGFSQILKFLFRSFTGSPTSVSTPHLLTQFVTDFFLRRTFTFGFRATKRE